ncbi:uncharacterized protein EI90DRAFT_2612991 [Cantharellus anzutake]|uniref:uncharacterized protein n=1 Tax=Cantharellus anzutake TaxID=1750568 RepID=UPI001908BE49|nr:uncharacterized protein EI90DRAFT_2612991 [Cantharellus anzutake]KAF8320181.1 hypothetical protein EI90DRAFT_2612991 [Cantharellus anzutake]
MFQTSSTYPSGMRYAVHSEADCVDNHLQSSGGYRPIYTAGKNYPYFDLYPSAAVHHSSAHDDIRPIYAKGMGYPHFDLYPARDLHGYPPLRFVSTKAAQQIPKERFVAFRRGLSRKRSTVQRCISKFADSILKTLKPVSRNVV